jgi:hypothetical protein
MFAPNFWLRRPLSLRLRTKSNIIVSPWLPGCFAIINIELKLDLGVIIIKSDRTLA